MGTDIHFFVEKKNSEGVWEQEVGFVSDFYDERCEFFGKVEYLSTPNPVDQRNYTLFAFLADVRNGRQIKPVAAYRGLPEGMSKGVLDYFEEDDDLHSKTHMTLTEVVTALDHHEGIRADTVLDQGGLKDYIKTGKCGVWDTPKAYYTGVEVSQEVMISAIKDRVEMVNHWCIVTVNVEVKELLTSFIEKSLPQLIERSDVEDYSDIRLIMGFDC